MSPQAPALATDVPADLLDAVRREIREAGVLQVAPEQFHLVEFGRVERQPGEVPATMSDQPGGNDPMLVGEPAIPDEDALVRRTTDPDVLAELACGKLGAKLPVGKLDTLSFDGVTQPIECRIQHVRNRFSDWQSGGGTPDQHPDIAQCSPPAPPSQVAV
jgi:hypothetical protein